MSSSSRKMAGALGSGCARMVDPIFWTMERLATLREEIAAFESAAFGSSRENLTAKKKRMSFIARSCGSSDVAYILGRSIGDMARNPDYVRRAICLARQHVDILEGQ